MAESKYGVPLPAVFGRELAGIVTALGTDAHELASTDDVVCSLMRYCGHCQACLAGRP